MDEVLRGLDMSEPLIDDIDVLDILRKRGRQRDHKGRQIR